MSNSQHAMLSPIIEYHSGFNSRCLLKQSYHIGYAEGGNSLRRDPPGVLGEGMPRRKKNSLTAMSPKKLGILGSYPTVQRNTEFWQKWNPRLLPSLCSTWQRCYTASYKTPRPSPVTLYTVRQIKRAAAERRVTAGGYDAGFEHTL